MLMNLNFRKSVSYGSRMGEISILPRVLEFGDDRSGRIIGIPSIQGIRLVITQSIQCFFWVSHYSNKLDNQFSYLDVIFALFKTCLLHEYRFWFWKSLYKWNLVFDSGKIRSLTTQASCWNLPECIPSVNKFVRPVGRRLQTNYVNYKSRMLII